MRKLVVSQFSTVDGVVDDPGGSEDFEHGGWAFEFDRGEEGDKFKLDELMASDVLLLGRVTYEGFAKAWPSREGEFADKFNNMTKYVVSTTLDDPEWNNTRVIKDNVADEVSELKREDGGDILVNGSTQLVQALAAADLVDEYRFMVFPVVLGTGKQLFTKPIGPKPLQLVESRPAGETLITIYKPKS